MLIYKYVNESYFFHCIFITTKVILNNNFGMQNLLLKAFVNPSLDVRLHRRPATARLEPAYSDTLASPLNIN